jgi:IS30 family transposase
MKKLLVYGPIAMALIASLAVGIPAAVAADTSDAVSTETTTTTTSDEQKPGQELMSRVAEILNIDEATVSDAFQQATQELMTERQQERLQNAVDNGLITEEEAAEIQAWMNSRPEALEGMGPLGGEGQGRGRMMGPADDCACCAP